MTQNSKSIVISQPYYFPWVGLFEQLIQADIFIHYDDVQFSKGHFQDRVQIKTNDGSKWLTVPKSKVSISHNINEVKIDYSKNWQKSQLDFLKQCYRNAPFVDDMIKIVTSVFEKNPVYLSEISIASIEAVADYYDLLNSKVIVKSSEIEESDNSKSTERVFNICKYFGANKYITGMGALSYFDFELFEKHNIEVYFVDYQKSNYPQLFGDFNPFVSVLDLVANTGKDGVKYIGSKAVYWKDFINTSKSKEYLKKL